MEPAFEKYEALAKSGFDAVGVYRQAEQDGMDVVDRIRLVRKLFDLDLVGAKEVMAQASDPPETLSERQGRLIEGLEEALKELDK